MIFKKFSTIAIFFLLSNKIVCEQYNELPTLPVQLTSQNIKVAEVNAPVLVVALMVKDEKSVINATLAPFVKAGIDHYLIFDTGSTDGTQETVREYFKTNNIKNAHILEEPFINFAVSRNRALDLAEEKFPNATFILMIDAEWYTNNVKGLLDFCKKEINNINQKAYLIRVISYPTDFYHCRLIRCKSKLRFVGRVHEVIPVSSNTKIPQDIYIDYKPADKGVEKTVQRWTRDKKLLLEDYNEDPNNSRTTFYLAQTCEALNDYKSAYKYYEIRSKQNGWDEENYETFYRLGRVVEELLKVDKNFTWNMAMNYYLDSYKLRPHRAEPLIKIAEHYWPDNIPVSFLFARFALNLPYPKNEVLFVDKHIHDFTKNNLLGMTAFHVATEFENKGYPSEDIYNMGQEAVINSIKVMSPHLAHNLRCYMEKMKNKKLS